MKAATMTNDKVTGVISGIMALRIFRAERAYFG